MSDDNLTPEQLALQAKAKKAADDKQASAHSASQGKLAPVRRSGKTKQVIADEPGYYDHYRNTGDIFDVPEEQEVPENGWFRLVKRGKDGKPVSAEEELV